MFPQGDLDGAWKFAVNAAVAQHLVFGRDLVFTFGPYASVYTLSYHPATDALAMGASAVIAAAMAAGLIALTRGPWRWAAGLLAVSLGSLVLRDPLFLLLPVLFIALAGAPARLGTGAGILLSAAALGLLTLVKGTFAAGSFAALGAGGVILLWRQRWGLAAGVGLLAPLAVITGWMAAGQPLAALPGFFHAQQRIVDGYTEAMSLAGPMWQVALFAAGAVLVIGLNVPGWRRAGVAGLVAGLGTALLLLLAFKAGFVRQDEHAVIAGGTLGLAGFVLALAHRGAGPTIGLVAAAIVWGALAYSTEGMGPRRALLQVETATVQAMTGLLDRARGGSARHDGYEAALADLRAQRSLPTPAGTSDIYSSGQASLLAHGFAWSPRPVLQSYSAYSPELAALDAAHLEAPDAPATVFFRPEPIDNHLPALEDGPSWLPLLARYEAVALSMDGTATLRRRVDASEPGGLSAATTSTHAFDETVALPPGPLWATVDVRPTLAGRALSAIFRPPPLRISIHFVNGRTIVFRFVAGMGRAGFLISPVVADAAHLVALAGPGASDFEDYVPDSFTMEGDARFWNGVYGVAVAPLHLPPRADPAHIVFQVAAPAELPSNTASRCWLDMIDGRIIDHGKRLDASGLVRLNGWAFGDIDPGVVPDAVSLWYRTRDGVAHTVPAMPQYRPDVGAYFHQPQLTKIGFQALIDLDGVSGDVTLGASMTQGARSWSCTLMDASVR